jgi:hypothetical protein
MKNNESTWVRCEYSALNCQTGQEFSGKGNFDLSYPNKQDDRTLIHGHVLYTLDLENSNPISPCVSPYVLEESEVENILY